MCEEAFKNCTLSLIEGTPVDQARHLEECAKDVAVISMLILLLYIQIIMIIINSITTPYGRLVYYPTYQEIVNI